MLQKNQHLCHKIASLESQLAQLPEGTLSCPKNGNYYQWIYLTEHEKQYLPKSRRPFAEQLAAKRYLSLLLQDLKKEQKAVQSFLKHYPVVRNSETLLLKSPEIKNLLFPPASQTNLPDSWESESYQRNPNHTEHLVHECVSGNKVRSKSESMIDMFLFLNRIPYRYECELTLGTSTIYPDFTICHPKTKKIYYWEHFGMMDDPAYARKAAAKLQLYISHQIFPTIHLITTYETKEIPLSPSTVESIIAHYFLKS